MTVASVPSHVTDEPPRAASLPPGFDEEDPYEDEDLSTYPEWWRRNVEEFREYGMRPYRPPRLADGTLTPPLIEELEAEYGASVRFRAVDPQVGNSWELVVDGDAVCEVEHLRSGDGYTVYDLEEEQFREAVREAVQRTT
jgi:hypothetical protein